MKVIVLGGGVAGMSAAHELAERDIEVVVYETRAIPGGKARSIPVPASGKRGRGDLPAEHGFRFFPGFYRHLPDTMKRIPFGGQRDGVLDNLVPTSAVQLALEGRAEIVTPAHFPASLDDLEQAFESLMAQATTLGIPVVRPGQFRQRAAPPADQLPVSAASPSTSTRAGGSSRGRRRARPSTASSSPTD